MLPIIDPMKPRILTTLLATALCSAPLLAADGDTSAPTAPAENSQPASAGGAGEAAPTRAMPNPSAAIQSDLARQLEATTELVWLETGDSPTLALSAPHNTREKLGTVVILHDQHTSADWPELVSTLRKGLPDKGWATLSVQLPDAPWPAIPARTLPGSADGNNADATADSNSEAAAENRYSEALNTIADAVFAQVGEDRSKLVVLGVGTGAVWAADFVRNREQARRSLSLVMVDSRQPGHPQAPDLMTLLPEMSSTVLDLYHGSTFNENAAANPRNRSNLARREQLDNFHQSRLPLLAGDWKKRNQWVLSRVRGFMQTHIVEAEEQRKNKLKRRRTAGPVDDVGPGGTPVTDGMETAGSMMEEAI